LAFQPDFGIGPWLEFGEVEDQLRIVRPRVLRKSVSPGMVPLYALLAHELEYCTVVLDVQDNVRLLLIRKDRRIRVANANVA
jgi:hypothetical protein